MTSQIQLTLFTVSKHFKEIGITFEINPASFLTTHTQKYANK